jgi:hypothetical protein
VLDPPEVIATRFYHLAAQAPLGEHGVARDDHAGQLRLIQYLRGDHDCIRFGIDRSLSQHHALIGLIGGE